MKVCMHMNYYIVDKAIRLLRLCKLISMITVLILMEHMIQFNVRN